MHCNYSQTSLIRSSFIRSSFIRSSFIRSSFIWIPRHPEENCWLPIYSICHAHIQCVCSIIRFPRLSGYFSGKRLCAVKRGLTVHRCTAATTNYLILTLLTSTMITCNDQITKHAWSDPDSRGPGMWHRHAPCMPISLIQEESRYSMHFQVFGHQQSVTKFDLPLFLYRNDLLNDLGNRKLSLNSICR